jgi:hypothetical protein
MTMTPFERWAVWLTTAGTLVTGLAYWWMKDLMPSTDPWAVINHPLQPWALKAHILVAPFMVFSVGLITSRHIWRHYRLAVRKGRRSGLLAALSFVVLVLSGYVLQVFTAETLLRALGWIHLGLGVLYSVAVAAHWPATRGRQRIEDAPVAVKHPVLGREGGGMASHERRRRQRARSARSTRASGAARTRPPSRTADGSTLD